MPGRTFSAENAYRYGFNGKENDKDISEGGQDYGMRINDVRLGRFLSVDPLTEKFAYFSPYQFSGNNPLRFIDLDGAEPFDPFTRWLVKDAMITMVQNPNSGKAKAYGVVMGIGGCAVGAAEGITHPIQSLKSFGNMFTKTIEQNAIDYAVTTVQKYGDLPEPVMMYAVMGNMGGDIIMGASPLKNSLIKKTPGFIPLGEQGLIGEAVGATMDLGRDLNQVSKGFPTFDFFKSETGLATSSKTFNLAAETYMKNPRQLLYTANKYIKDIAGFTSKTRKGFTLSSDQIAQRQLHIHTIGEVFPAQALQLNAIRAAANAEMINTVFTGSFNAARRSGTGFLLYIPPVLVAPKEKEK